MFLFYRNTHASLQYTETVLRAAATSSTIQGMMSVKQHTKLRNHSSLLDAGTDHVSSAGVEKTA